MSNTIAKNLHHLCFSLIKRPQHQLTNSPNHHINRQHPPPQPPITTTFTKNYNSLYEDMICLPPISTSVSNTDTDTDTDMSDLVGPETPDLTAVYASRRFFISSPGRSNSIVDSLSSSSPEEEPDLPTATMLAAAGGVAVETYSPDPYTDFRRSMQEMMVAREVAREDVMGAWEYLQELLLSYLALNPKNTHKYIVRAFADVVVSSMSPIININNNNNGASSSPSPSFSSYYGVNNCSDHNNNSAYVEIFNHAT